MGVGILPTPAIGGVGLVADVTQDGLARFKAAGDDVLLIGGAPGWLGRSAWLAIVAGREEGAPPPVDLAAERRNGEFVLRLIADGPCRPASTTCPTAASPSRSPRWRWRAGVGATVALRRARACVLLRRGSGPLCRDGAPAGGAAPSPRRRRAPGCSALAHRRHRRRRADARRRGAGRPCGASPEAYESWLPDTDGASGSRP